MSNVSNVSNEVDVLQRTFTNASVTKVRARLDVKIGSDGKVVIVLTAKNRRLFNKAFVTATVEVLSREGTVYHHHFALFGLQPVFNSIGRKQDASSIHQVHADTIDLNGVSYDGDVEEDQQIKDVDQQIAEAAQKVRELRVFLERDDPKYLEAVSHLEQLKTRRDTVYELLVNRLRLTFLTVTGTLEVQV